MTKRPKISSYFSDNQYKLEKKLFQEEALGYLGHKLMVSNQNDYQVCSHTHDRYTIFNHGSEINLVSNICPHRQAKLLTGSGNKKNISCKLHCWTFSNKGELKGTPHFKEDVDVKLELLPTYEWNGLLFKNRAPVCDLKESGVDKLINFDNYIYDSTESEEYNFNWKTFVEIYLENYHVFSMHPGLKHFVSPSDLEWSFGNDFSIQKVGIGKDLNRSGSEIYKNWQKAVQDEHKDIPLRYGAIWVFMYPNIMIEWYPNILVISTIHPTSAQTCINHVEFYYPKDLYEKNPDYFTKEKAAYMETAVEDNEACLLLQEGRRSLYLNGDEMHGPIEPFLEAGVKHFYDYLDEKLS